MAHGISDPFLMLDQNGSSSHRDFHIRSLTHSLTQSFREWESRKQEEMTGDSTPSIQKYVSGTGDQGSVWW